MSFDHLPKGFTYAQLRAADCAGAAQAIEDDVHDFRHFADLVLRKAPVFLTDDELYAFLCDLAANHPVYQFDYESAQLEMDDWNNLKAVSHDALPRLEAAIRADLA